MAIKVQCPNPTCGKVFSVKEEHAGRKAKCPGCSSPLIIPTPEAGAFDFGALASGTPPAEPGNPFAELAAAPPPTPSKARPAKKPVPEPANTFEPQGTAAPPVAEAIVEVLPESIPSPAAVPLPTPGPPLAEPEGFPAVADAGPADHLTRPEPWYYGFLDGYAKLLLYLGFLAVFLATLFPLWTAFQMLQVSLVTAIILMLGTLAVALVAIVGVLLTVALILLTVDAARNLREIRKLLVRRLPEKSDT